MIELSDYTHRLGRLCCGVAAALTHRLGRLCCGIAAALLLSLLPLTTQAQAQRWWGYYTDASTPHYMGTQTAETYTCCAQFSASRSILSGATVHGVRFALRDKTNVSDVQVFLSSSRPNSADQADILSVSVSQDQLADLDHDGKMTEVTLPESYAMPASGSIYVGFAYKLSSAKSAADKEPIVCAGQGNGGSGTFWIRSSKSLLSWNDMGSRYGALALQLLVSNPSLPAQSVKVSALERPVMLAGQTGSVIVRLASEGLNPVSSIDYVLTVGDQPQSEQHYVLPEALYAPDSETDIDVPVTAPSAASIYDYTVQVTKVNGAANSSELNSQRSPLLSISQLGHRRTVVEEYTGTWCTNCPRGIVGMENLADEFGDDFIGIAVHTNNGATRDPMYLSAYSPLIPSGVPRCQMDRLLWCDPYMGLRSDYHYHADEAFRLLRSQPSEADLQLTAVWSDAAQTKLLLTAATTFHLSTDRNTYALAFVITEDGMSGTTKEWWQVNGESGRNTFPDDDMERFRNAPDPVTDISYNHVAIAAQDVVFGTAGSITVPIADSQQQTYNTTFNLSTNTLLQDKTQLTAVALLIDRTTGMVVNAAKAEVSGEASVESVVSATQQTERWYTLDGRQLSNSKSSNSQIPKGLYIHGNKKVIIK